MSVTDAWRPKRPGPASDRDSVTRQTLRAGMLDAELCLCYTHDDRRKIMPNEVLDAELDAELNIIHNDRRKIKC